jgi:tryptophanase
MWAALMLGDESYARNHWYYVFLDAIRDFTERGDKPNKRYISLFDEPESFEKIMQNFSEDEKERGFVNGGLAQLEHPNFFILPQGRCCENVLFESLRTYWKEEKNSLVLSNGLFDTTRANVKLRKFEGIDLFSPDIFADYPLEKVGKENPFRGNIDIPQLEKILDKDGKKTALIVMTLTNNTGAGQPVSMQNMKDVRKLCEKHNVPLWIDAARITDNAALIKRYEKGYENMSTSEILKELFSMADGFHFSLKKILANMGGVMCFKHEGLFDKKYPKIGDAMKKHQIINYGNDSYGGMSGRDIAAVTVGLYQVVKEDYIYSRIDQCEYLAVELAKKGVPVVLPPGSHAIYIDINRMFKDSPWENFMGVGLASELLVNYGIRTCELGYMAWELDVYVEKHGKLPEHMPPNLVRLAIPANVHNREHMDYVVEALDEINKKKDQIPPYEVYRAKNAALRHFIVGLRPKKE